MRLVRNHEVEVRRGEQRPVLVVEQQRLNGADHDFGAPPVVPPFLIYDGFAVLAQVLPERDCRLTLEFQPVHEKQDAPRVARSEEQLDDGGGDKRLAGSRRHLEQESVRPAAGGALKGSDGVELIRAQESQAVGADEIGALRFVQPRGFGGVRRALGERDVIFPDALVGEARRVGLDLAIVRYGILRGKRGYDGGVAALQIPKVVEVAVGQDDETAAERARVPPRLLFGGERVFVGRFGFENGDGALPRVKQKEVRPPGGRLLEIVSERGEVVGADGDCRLQTDVGGRVPVREKAPAGFFQQPVYSDAGGGFVHSRSQSLHLSVQEYL